MKLALIGASLLALSACAPATVSQTYDARVSASSGEVCRFAQCEDDRTRLFKSLPAIYRVFLFLTFPLWDMNT